ncbi:tigger transposable element-derived protein 4-like [Leptopilina heterotoma]|uniref:tigger transposable element-derived protein 4-like n=1 Tax=Leptopilina heterotoma TaxID=63436 RepID=UPI001CAA11EC|nr:tigger transposable element-derived protein 4-like [Leptopilina heterotoma]
MCKVASVLEKEESGENLSFKRQRTAEFPNLEECLLTWFKQCRDKNITVSGPVLMEKAEFYAKSLKIDNFRVSNGWLEKFKKRHGLTFRKICGESKSVNNDVCEEWKGTLQNLVKEYDPSDIFNADETGLFYKCLPDKTLVFKGEKCHGGKHSKERLTVLLAVNMSGSEKLTPFVIGKSKKPRCFAGCKSLPVQYDANKKAWMNSEIFRTWLLQLNKEMIRKKRKIMLFIDNCTAHKDISSLKAVKVIFLTPNTTSILQPLDQGIIQNFKIKYRTEVVRKMIVDMENNTVSSINVLQALRMVDKAWRGVTQETITNCFKKCAFPSTSEEIVEMSLTLPIEWNQLKSTTNITFEEFTLLNKDLSTTGMIITDSEIIDSIKQNDEDEDLLLNDEDLPTSFMTMLTHYVPESQTFVLLEHRSLTIRDHQRDGAKAHDLVDKKRFKSTDKIHLLRRTGSSRTTNPQ